jgi:hypothetical protein
VTDMVRIYIDAKPVDAVRGSQLIDALAAASPSQADQVRDGARVFTDSRGLPASPDSEVYDGAIYRLVSARTSSTL